VESSESRSERGIGLQKPENLLLLFMPQKQILRRFAPQNDRRGELRTWNRFLLCFTIKPDSSSLRFSE